MPMRGLKAGIILAFFQVVASSQIFPLCATGLSAFALQNYKKVSQYATSYRAGYPKNL
ncbi:MAG: hypothetical protein K2F99_03840 [Muribaculaceae bacterium]|nr:hypothetical protein [Muribaculaceae bacterium]